ncbi:MAG: hypothetical protein CMM48_14030 [Rhodospirillaceae bacterium]|nr:hypothetical protein [Rhodospirillaceae bacterium]HAA92918.1 hypothetical protein [Rhodospirillaceae bacterium]
MANRRERRREKRKQRKNGRHTPLEAGPPSGAGRDLMSEAARLYEAGDIGGAKSTFELIITMEPGHADALFGLGVLIEQQGDVSTAKGHYQTAVESEPNHAPSLVNLGNILRNEQQYEKAIEYLDHAAKLAADVPLVHNNLGIALHQGGRIDDAIPAFEKALGLAPDFVEAHCNLGAVHSDLDEFDEAIICFERALELAPDYGPALANLGNALNGLHRVDEAIVALEKAVTADPNGAFAYVKLAIVHERLNQLDKAKEYIGKARKIDSNNPEVLMVSGIIHGRNKEYDLGIKEIEAGIPKIYSPNILCRAHFEAGHLYDRLNNVRNAFEHYRLGNELIEAKAVRTGVDRDEYLKEISHNINIINNNNDIFINKLSKKQNIAPIFVVGFPRSGTTLLEQILDSHPSIQALDEKPVIEDTIRYFENKTGNYPECIDQVNDDNIEEIRSHFYSEVNKYLSLKSSKILAYKMPLNMVHAGFIYKIFPEAKFIFTERHPCDACLSCFMQHFTLNRAMTHFTSLQSTAEFYVLVMGLWRRYTEEIPLDWQALRYENLVENFESTVRELLEFLELDWDDAVLAYDRHAQNRTVMTPSYSQVTQPIYDSSRERWRRYEEEMAPVLPILAPFIRHFGYDGADATDPTNT